MFSSLSINDISIAVVTEEFLTSSSWTASKLGDWSEIVKNPDFDEPTNQKRSAIDKKYDYHKDPAWHQSRINELYADYHKDPAQYQNHSVYECLKAYMNMFDWRPLTLILVSSDTESFLHLNSSALLQWEMIRSDSAHYGYPLCGRDPDFQAKCESKAFLNSKNISTYTYQGNKVDYALYKDMDSVRTKMKTCYFHGSPQILMGMFVSKVSVFFILTKDLS